MNANRNKGFYDFQIPWKKHSQVEGITISTADSTGAIHIATYVHNKPSTSVDQKSHSIGRNCHFNMSIYMACL